MNKKISRAFYVGPIMYFVFRLFLGPLDIIGPVLCMILFVLVGYMQSIAPAEDIEEVETKETETKTEEKVEDARP